MIQVKKKKLDKKQLTIIITASVLVFLIIGYAVISTLISSGIIGSAGGGSSQRPEVLEGESIVNGMSAAYPYIAKSNILSVAVSSHKDAFYMFRDKNSDGAYNNYFEFVYEDDDGKLVPYNPTILSKDYNTKYTDFYAVEKSDGLNATKIDYLCAAIGALYFDERINPEEDKEAQLRRYGLDKESRESILINYVNSEGKEDEITIFVGDSLITGVGYYYMIEGRDYIYTSAASERLEYLLSDFESFLHSRVVAAGIPSDGLYEPFLTTDYKQWTNKYYGISNGHEGEYVKLGSSVIIEADVITPVYFSEESDASAIPDGYRHGGYTVHSVDTSYINGVPHFQRLLAVLSSNPIGKYEGNELVVTVNSNINFADLGVKYKYTILSIESVITDDVEYYENGYAVGDNNLVKIVYNYEIDGAKKSVVPSHGIINLSDTNIPEEIRDAIKNASVGDAINREFEVTYSEENAVKKNVTKIVTGISIIDKQTSTGAIEYPEVVDGNCRVTYSYKYLIDGSYVLEEGTEIVDLSAITEGPDLEIKNKFIGKKVSKDLDIQISEETIYCQYISDFQVYSIRTIKGYVEEEMVVSFEYVNASARDPFYTESIYKNTLENENKYYALDATACQNVTFLLGGLGSSNNSQVSGGLVGSKTVAVGLTPANMDKFNLYDGYTIYFELPRGIVSIPGSADNEVADYKHLSTIGFNLYISKETSDGTRYIGSDMYDIIVEIDGTGFEFLEKTFEDYWTRRNLVMVNVSLVDKVKVELGMEDVYGKYEFDLNHKQIYISGNQHFDEEPENGGTGYDFITVYLTSGGNISDSAYSEILKGDLDGKISLETIYETVTGHKNAVGHDTEATANFKTLLNMIYSTTYSGVLSDEEIADAKANAPKIMSITFQLEGEKNNGNQYAYDFYRVSDRQVMVDLYRVDSDGNRIESSADDVSGFYISTFAAKKIINGVSSLLNGETIDQKLGYWD